MLLNTETEEALDLPHMTVKEFREQGYLQELNRQFLHPLGLALEVIRDAEGNEYFGEVYDGRADPEGFAFAELTPTDVERGQRISLEMERRRYRRLEILKFGIQPLTPTEGK